jgi:large subunit ribosomal protein L24e
MVIKTELCEFTEYRVYPGKGQRYVTKDGKVHFFISHKVASLFRQRIRPVKLTWTQAWRKMNKKGKTEAYTRKRTRRTQRIQKAFVGLSLDELKTKKAAPKPKTAETATKEHKEKAKKAALSKAPQVKAQVTGKSLPSAKPQMSKRRM